MQNIQISFGQKIPITNCRIKDNEKDIFIPASIYEIDCKDYSDIQEFKNIDGTWSFKVTIASNMWMKYLHQKICSIDDVNKFYVLETQNGKTLGLCQTSSENSVTKVDYIEKKQNENYKYIGQSLMAAVGMETLKEKNKRIEVPCPVERAVPFYVEKCGFSKTSGSIALKMYKKQIKNFITQTENKTHSKFKDLRV